ncbi:MULTISPECIES: hypothetical protein [unclassified Enterococcus]|uniref:hypothetical protein n=1 Tax=unclassified Enterococcus TaxID=2608891 RepID=UPI0015573503|nr:MULTISPECIES: hypothetical protein [unclassified Enterococcus]MBS7578447.1 hypothetical protein [Enterococcus sp. MMGLQ5-2]MBS7585688.1 hypothetical protein [Enterococcus sp. MMGLQ5-1]NPD13547.1 hypothetical protein [Enterococcus sp. MMGLQ5-1]NPD38279.1 hypothetical protein [Enterococcus sp. MMGLQ5-2]
MQAVDFTAINEASDRMVQAFSEFVKKVSEAIVKIVRKVVCKIYEFISNSDSYKVSKALSLYMYYGNKKYLDFVFRIVNRNVFDKE